MPPQLMSAHVRRLTHPVPAGLAVKFGSVPQDEIKLNHVQHHQRVVRRLHGPHLARQWHRLGMSGRWAKIRLPCAVPTYFAPVNRSADRMHMCA